MLLEIEDLSVSFVGEAGPVQVTDGVSLSIVAGETLALVGESGCGKSVTAGAVMRLLPHPAGRITAGSIRLRGRDLLSLPPQAMYRLRGSEVAMVFQEPMTCLNPVHTALSQVVEVLKLHRPDVRHRERRAEAMRLLEEVELPDLNRRAAVYPFQLSGGMRQRAMIAMALSCNPSLLIADEPTTALDVTIQAQILELMRGLQKRLGMAVMFITHNLGVIAQIADTVAIMYLGQVVEYGPVREILRNPKHPYTVDLLRAVPRLGKTAGQRLVAIEGSIPSPFQRPSGCPFHPRCSRAMAGRCEVHMPAITKLADKHSVRCLLYEPEKSDA